MRRVIRWTLDNALFVNLLTVFVLGVGFLKATQLRREAFPAVDYDIVMITTAYPGAAPSEVEQYVTDPLEDEIAKVDGIERTSSLSAEGFSLVAIKLDPDLDERSKDRAVNEIQRAVDRVRNLPEGVPERPLVRELESGDLPVIEIALTGDDFDELYRHAEILADRIEDLPDCEEVQLGGVEDREFWIEVDPQKLLRYQVGLELVIGALAAHNINVPGGTLETEDGEVLVRTIGEVTTPEAIARVVLRASDTGAILRIGDVATVRRAYAEATRIYRTDGRTSINLKVLKDADGDILRLVDQARALTERYLAAHPEAGLRAAYVNDISYYVRNRLGVLVNNGIFGLILVLLVLLLFLSKGIAFVTAMGLPVAFLGTMLVMGYAGMTVNLISMFGLIIVLGMLVDDAIIVGENIWQHYERGAPPREATLAGTVEVVVPVTATILTTIAAFSPLLMVSGIFGKFISEMPKVVIIALLMSLVEAVLVLPSHAYDILRLREWWRRRRGEHGPEEHRHLFLTPVLALYEKTLYWVLRLRYLFLLLMLGLLGFSLWWARTKIPFILFPSHGIEIFFIRADQPIGTSLERTAAAFEPLERIIAELPPEELKNFVTVVGIQQNDPNDPFTQRGSHLGQIAVYLTPENERQRTADEVIEALRPRIEVAAQEGGFRRVVFESMRPGPPVGKPVAIRIQGEHFPEMIAVADAVEAALRAITGVSDIDRDFFPGKDELHVVIDEAAAARAMLDVRTIARHVRAALAGRIATYVRIAGDRIALRVRYPDAARTSEATLASLLIPNRMGHLVRLDRIAHIERRPGLSHIIHRDEQRTITVSAVIDEKVTSSKAVNERLLPLLDRLMRENPEIHLKAEGEYEDTAKSMASLREAFVVALGLIFLILTLQFRSLTQPLVVLIAIPFGIIGVIWAFYLHGLPLSFLGFIGLIGLSGVVVNDAIVLVSFLNNARREGMPVFEAALHAGSRRFRAVWLTTLTTVLGLLPLVYGIGGFDRFLRPAALALGYGLIFGTVLILFFVPAVYLVRADVGRLLQRLVRVGNGGTGATGGDRVE